jgi:hypothetical protein
MPLYAVGAYVDAGEFKDWTVGSAVANTEQEAEAEFAKEVAKLNPSYKVVRTMAYAAPAAMIRQVVEVEGL